ncbi:hypothetical protein GOP56_11370 [Brevibacillus sp. 7WMA2]|uniref:hypothetical protein n=1 Tax=Brevibacillus sp. 7WMA2 TaxID=2683193 RepID=UPI0013A7A01F|nr:hypothetical protein [Brevibacillus sp. 7WMA2]QIC06154.1 hypothetical protein GOP56_11370 [Brevibacillus sp. 7WMA2]
MMTREEIGAIRKRAEDATVGSWRFCGDKFGDLIVYSPEIRGFRNNGGEIAVLMYGSDEDAEFIAHAREDIPKLLAEIERLRCETGEINYETTKLITPTVTSTANE